MDQTTTIIPKRTVGDKPSEHGVLSFTHLTPPITLTATTITTYIYSSEKLDIKTFDPAKDQLPVRAQNENLWLEIVGIQNTSAIGALLEKIGVAPKIRDHLFKSYPHGLILLTDESLLLVTEVPSDKDIQQKTLIYTILGVNYLVTIASAPLILFDTMKDRLGLKYSLSRNQGPDYLFSFFTACLLQEFLDPISEIGILGENLETQIINHPEANLMEVIYSLKKRLAIYSKEVWNIIHLLGALTRVNEHIIKKPTQEYIEICIEQAKDLDALVDGKADQVSALQDLYFNSTTYELNQVMKFLTILSTIFLPLSFLAGLWGMNFSYQASHYNMPELQWRYGYLMALSVMTIVAISFVTIFYKKGWLKLSKARLRIKDDILTQQAKLKASISGKNTP